MFPPPPFRAKQDRVLKPRDLNRPVTIRSGKSTPVDMGPKHRAATVVMSDPIVPKFRQQAATTTMHKPTISNSKFRQAITPMPSPNISGPKFRQQAATTMMQTRYATGPQLRHTAESSSGVTMSSLPSVVPSVRLGETSDGRRMPGFGVDDDLHVLKDQLARLEAGLLSVTGELEVQQGSTVRLKEEVNLWTKEAAKWRAESEAQKHRANLLEVGRKIQQSSCATQTDGILFSSCATQTVSGNSQTVEKAAMMASIESSLNRLAKNVRPVKSVATIHADQNARPVRSVPTVQTDKNIRAVRAAPTIEADQSARPGKSVATIPTDPNVRRVKSSDARAVRPGKLSDRLIVVSARSSPELSAAGQQARALLSCLDDPELVETMEACFGDEETISRDACLLLVPAMLSKLGLNVRCALPKVICSRMLRSLTSSRFEGTPTPPRLRKDQTVSFLRLVLEFIVEEERAVGRPEGLN